MAHIQIDEIGAHSVLVPQKQRGGSFTDYTLNPYVGCGIGCAYCYVMKFPFAAQHPLPWGAWVQPKMNAPFLLNKARARIWGRRVFLGSATDPYQYIERRYRLTRQCLAILVDKTGLQALPRAQAYFRSQADLELVAELQACLQEVGLLDEA